MVLQFIHGCQLAKPLLLNHVASRNRSIPSGLKYRLFDGMEPLSYGKLVRLFGQDQEFAAWYTRLLIESGLNAFYWEHPPLTAERLKQAAEFILIEAPALATLRPDPTPFRSHFDATPDDDVLVFPNLGGDAILIVPRPHENRDEYPHLATFLRMAPPAQIREFWQCTWAAVYQNVTSAPRWLSTAGLGVAWLHARIDTRPKYYSHVPYTQYP